MLNPNLWLSVRQVFGGGSGGGGHLYISNNNFILQYIVLTYLITYFLIHFIIKSYLKLYFVNIMVYIHCGSFTYILEFQYEFKSIININ